MLENFLGFTLENVANVSRRKLGVVGGGGGTRNFRANDAKYFLCSQGVAVCRPMSHECAITRLLGASIFSFLGMEFIRSWAKKKKSGADEDTVICSTFSFRTIYCLFRII